jgi:ABC-type transport system involved in multi-copper enzyme maturation permease subunit
MSISLPTYTRRDIPLQGRRHRTWAIYTTGLRGAIRRPAAIFVVGVGTAITTIVSLVLVLFAPFLLPGQPLDLTFFVTPATNPAIFFFVTLMAGAVGGGLIADDLDSMALTLYLSRPVTAADYLTAKAGILATLTSMVTILPLVLTPFLGALLGLFAWDVALEALGISILLGLLLTGFFTAIGLFLSSITRRRAYAAAGVFAIIFGLVATESILAQPGFLNDPAVLYLSPSEEFAALARAAFGAPTGPIDWAAALAIILGVTVLAALATWIRMRAIEVVSG